MDVNDQLNELGFSPDEAARVVRFAQQFVERGDWDDAREALRRAREADASGGQALEIALLAFRIELSSGAPDMAEMALARLIAIAPKDNRSWHHRARRVLEGVRNAEPWLVETLSEKLRDAAPQSEAEDRGGSGRPMRVPNIVIAPSDPAGFADEPEYIAPSVPGAEGSVVPSVVEPLPILFDGAETVGAGDVESDPLPVLFDPHAGEPEPTADAVEANGAAEAEKRVVDALLELDPFDNPDAYLRPHVAPVPVAPPEQSNPHGRDVDPGFCRLIHVDEAYQAPAEVRRQRAGRTETDAMVLLREFVREQIGQSPRDQGQIAREEAESAYDLGTTFLQMEQFESAWTMFEQAMQHCDFQVPATEGFLQAQVMGGQAETAYMIGQFALRTFARLGMPLIGIRYWQAMAAEARGMRLAARDLYEQVLAEDEYFEDAKERLDALQPTG